jgi:ATP-dependent DNA helicase RecQ
MLAAALLLLMLLLVEKAACAAFRHSAVVRRRLVQVRLHTTAADGDDSSVAAAPPAERSDVETIMNQVEAKMLPQLFGHVQFRPGQREVITRVLANQSCLAVLPTGAGKSLLYMLPSQLLDGITLVVSPLLALMRDQVEVLQSQGLAAARLDSSMSFEEIRDTIADIQSKRVKVLYVSPERFNNEGFRRVLGTMKVFWRLLLHDVPHRRC